MGIVSRGTAICSCCGEKLYDYVEFVGANGEIDGDITKEYQPYEGDLCKTCYENSEEEEEE